MLSCASQGVYPAQCVRDAQLAGHAADQPGGLAWRNPGSGDEQRPGGASAHDLHRMAGHAETGLGYADDRNTERYMCVRSQARVATGIKIDIAVDDEQAQSTHIGEHGTAAAVPAGRTHRAGRAPPRGSAPSARPVRLRKRHPRRARRPHARRRNPDSAHPPPRTRRSCYRLSPPHRMTQQTRQVINSVQAAWSLCGRVPRRQGRRLMRNGHGERPESSRAPAQSRRSVLIVSPSPRQQARHITVNLSR